VRERLRIRHDDRVRSAVDAIASIEAREITLREPGARDLSALHCGNLIAKWPIEIVVWILHHDRVGSVAVAAAVALQI